MTVRAALIIFTLIALTFNARAQKRPRIIYMAGNNTAEKEMLLALTGGADGILFTIPADSAAPGAAAAVPHGVTKLQRAIDLLYKRYYNYRLPEKSGKPVEVYKENFTLLINNRGDENKFIAALTKLVQPYADLFSAEGPGNYVRLTITGGVTNPQALKAMPTYITYALPAGSRVDSVAASRLAFYTYTPTAAELKGSLNDKSFISHISTAAHQAAKAGKPLYISGINTITDSAANALAAEGVGIIATTHLPTPSPPPVLPLPVKANGIDSSLVYMPAYKVDGVIKPLKNLIVISVAESNTTSIPAQLLKPETSFNLQRFKNLGIIKKPGTQPAETFALLPAVLDAYRIKSKIIAAANIDSVVKAISIYRPSKAGFYFFIKANTLAEANNILLPTLKYADEEEQTLVLVLTEAADSDYKISLAYGPNARLAGGVLTYAQLLNNIKNVLLNGRHRYNSIK